MKFKGELDKDRRFLEVVQDIEAGYNKIEEFAELPIERQLRERLALYGSQLAPFADRKTKSLNEAELHELRLCTAKMLCTLARLVKRQGLKLHSIFEPFYCPRYPEDEADEEEA